MKSNLFGVALLALVISAFTACEKLPDEPKAPQVSNKS